MNSLSLREILSVAAILFGLFFYFFGVLGIVRFPDVYMRIHSSGKVSALGIFGLCLGVAILSPDDTFRAFLLGSFMFVTQPVSSHAIAQAAYRSGVKMHKPIRDDWADKTKMTQPDSRD